MIRLSLDIWESTDFTWDEVGGSTVVLNHNKDKYPLIAQILFFVGGNYTISHDVYYNGTFSFGWVPFGDGSITTNTYKVFLHHQPAQVTSPAKARLIFSA